MGEDTPNTLGVDISKARLDAHRGGGAVQQRCGRDRKYRELVGRGKPPKVALTAVMRKLLLLANALLRHNRLWTPRADKPKAQPAENAGDASAASAGTQCRGSPSHPPLSA